MTAIAAGVWLRARTLAYWVIATLPFGACAGRADGGRDANDGGGSSAGSSSASGTGASGGGLILAGNGGGPTTTITPGPPQSAGADGVESAAGGACDSPGPHACNDLQGYLDDVPSDGVDIELGSGDLTLLVIFDRSGSMGDGWDLRNKWQAASDSMIAGMAPYLANLTIGAVLFPTVECNVAPVSDTSQINFMPGAGFVSQWVESACDHQPAGLTPMGAAFAVADQSMARARDLGLLEDRFRVMLVTDGEPNCDTDPAALVSYAQTWHDELGVETWVIGLPGSEQATALLDSIAFAGGTEKHTQAGNPCQFQATVGAAAK
jgi:hypothetical protein